MNIKMRESHFAGINEREAVIPEQFEEFKSLVALGRTRAQVQKGKMAYSMLKYGTGSDSELSYEELDRRARALAAKLQAIGAGGRHALLLFPSGLEFVVAFMACLYAGVVAVPTPMPGRKDKDWVRAAAIARDAEVFVVLTVAAQAEFIRASMDEDSFLRQAACIDTDAVPEALAAHWVDPQVGLDDLAFLQYTSGSTGMPKGVMVTHGNLLHNQEMMRKAYSHTEGMVCVSWLPLFHDMGLIGNVLHTLYLGAQCYLMTPVAFLQQPLRWLQAISDYKASTCFAPNFAYELCLRRVTEEQRDALDLSHWTMALNGAEPVRADTLERFAQYFGPAGFAWTTHYPAYGLAEATLFVAGTGRRNAPHIVTVERDALKDHRVVYSAAAHGTQRLVSSGLTDTVQQLAIVNPDTLARCAAREVGEIWIKGDSVAKGYWKKPVQTEETFQARLAGNGEGPYLRTGDLGFIDDGHLFITGRLKDVLIINGANFYPQDVELALQSAHSGLRQGYGAVFGIDHEGHEQIVVVQEVERTHLKKLDPQQVFAAIREAVLREFQIPVAAIVLIKPMTLPLTSSGKIQRRGTSKQFGANALAPLASWYGAASLRREIEGDALLSQAPDTVQTCAAKADAMIAWLRSYGETRINSMLIDERRSVPPYIVMDLARQGLFGMCVGEQYGGSAMAVSSALRVLEQLAALDPNLGAMVSVHHVLGTRPIANFGSQALKDRWLPQLASGRILGALAVTEPGAGSNPHAILTSARPSAQGGWLIDGEKCWIGNGSWAGVINVLAQVFDSAGRPRGLTAFAIEQGRAGMSMGEESPTMGMRGMVQNRVHFHAMAVTEADLLGRIGQGMEVAQDAMMHGRLVIAAMSLGALKRAAQLMTRFAQRREVATGVLLANPVTLQRLSELHASITVVQAMVSTMGQCIDAGVDIPAEVYAVCKTVAPELLWQGVDRLMQLLGGRGYAENNPVAQMMRDARLFRIFEGPTEALNMFIGARVGNHGHGVMPFVAKTLNSPAVADDLAAMATRLAQAAAASARRLGLSAGQGNHWIQALTGELASLQVAKAFVLHHARLAPSAALRQAQDWLDACIAVKTAEQQAALATPAWLSATELFEAAQAFSRDIGDVQQHAPGMERALDPALARATPAAVPALPASPGAPPLAAQGDAGDDVAQWVVSWLRKHRHGAASDIDLGDPRTTFVDLGIDSVSAVELAFALQTWLGIEVDPTVIWQYPSIGALARFLAGERSGLQPGEPAGQSAPPVPQQAQAAGSGDLSGLSDEELERALANELN